MEIQIITSRVVIVNLLPVAIYIATPKHIASVLLYHTLSRPSFSNKKINGFGPLAFGAQGTSARSAHDYGSIHSAFVRMDAFAGYLLSGNWTFLGKLGCEKMVVPPATPISLKSRVLPLMSSDKKLPDCPFSHLKPIRSDLIA